MSFSFFNSFLGVQSYLNFIKIQIAGEKKIK